MVSSSRPQPHHSSSSFGNSSAASTILGAFGRRPRTATNSRDRQGLPTDYADSNEDLRSSSNGNNRSRISLVSRAGIPRSNSSSHIHRMSPQDSSNSSSRFAFPSSSTATDEGMRAPAMAAQNSSGSMTNTSRPSRQGGEAFPGMTRTQSSQGGGGSSSSSGVGGGAFGRYFRRYSQGAGKNMAAAQEAHSIAAASNSSRQSGGGSNDAAAALAPTRTEGGSSSTNSYLASPGATSSMSASQTAPSLLSTAVAANQTPSAAPARATEAALPPVPASEATAATNHRLRLVPHLEATRSLHFEPIERDLVEGAIAVRIGRFTDRSAPPAGAADSAIAAGGGPAAAGVAASGSDGEGNNAGANMTSSAVTTAGAPGPTSGSFAGPSGMTASTSTGGMPGARGGAIMSSAGGGGRVDSGRIAFKSKVVSRGHAEVWCEAGGKFFIRDTKSSSGTFLNHIRLSHPNLESKPFPLKDGDVVQLGVDYQGGTEEIYRCVKMRVELNRGWQRGANQFNVNALRQLRALQGSPMPEPAAAAATSPAGGAKSAAAALPTNRQSMNVTDCCICLFSVTVCQALFIAPCSHVFHFKCIRPLIEQHHPGFCCPLCRTFADLDADVEEDEAWQQALLQEAQMGTGFPAAVGGPMDISTPMAEEPALNFSSGGPALATGVSMQSLDAVLPVLDSSSIEGEDASSRRPSSLRRAVLGTMGSDDDHLASTHERYHSPSNSSNAHSVVEGHSGQQRHTSSNTRGPQVAASEGEEAQEVMYDAPALLQGVPLHLRRPSAPISIRGATTTSSSATTSQPHRSPMDGFIQSPSFLDARTPQNEHFLSTLAEAPPPSRSALQAMDPSVNTIGDNTLFPGSILDSGGGERRVSNATNNSSLHAETGDAYTTPAQGNSPPTGSSPLSDEEGNGETNTAGSSAAVHSVASSNNNTKGKTAADTTTTAPPSSVKNAMDFLSGQHGTGSARRTRESSGVDSVESSDRGSSRDGGKVARFFKRNSTTFGS